MIKVGDKVVGAGGCVFEVTEIRGHRVLVGCVGVDFDVRRLVWTGSYWREMSV